MDVIVGTAGHIDHGKTALVKALTGVDADRLPEEKLRGITIDLGFAELDLGDGLHAAFVDVPGHERFVKNMLAGASGTDLVLLVIAADEGVMPQTREHFDICRLLGIRHGLVAITKRDLVDSEMLDLVKMETAELVNGSFLENAPVVDVSSRTGHGVEDLKRAIEEISARIERSGDGASTFLPIDRSFAIKGFGTVVTGTLVSGELAIGDGLELLPESRRVRVRGLQSHSKQIDRVSAGRRVAVNLGGIAHDEVTRGEVLGPTGMLRPTQIINAEVELLETAPRSLRSRQRVRIHIGTAEILARVSVLNETGEIEPGGRDFVQLRLESPAVSRFGDRFILRSYSPQITVGGGRTLDPLAERTRRKQLPELRVQLAKLASPRSSQADILKTFIDAAADRGVSNADLQARTGWRGDVLTATVEALGDSSAIARIDDVNVSVRAFEGIKSSLVARVTEHHKRDPLSKGISREALRTKMQPLVFISAISALMQEKKLESSGDTLSLSARGAQLTPEEIVVRDRLVETLLRSGLEVPKLSELVEKAVAGRKVSAQQAKKILKLLYDSGEAVKVTEEFVFSRRTIEGLTAKLLEFAKGTNDRSIDVTAFKDLAGVSRKYAIPLLEYFDREKVTLRVGDKRVIR